ncbi:MAG: hypothetical protein PHE83_12825 [Opitutaceae bacterium]|nr:hypothetical protein [Opitutaceae bacterium]
MKTKITKYGQPSWRIANAAVEAFVTETGGHLGPVTFQIGGKKIQPYAVAPWAEEKLEVPLPPMLKVLRGDFFCLPFGGNETPFRDERHPPHGETANARWRCTAAGEGRVHLSLVTKARPGRVDKFISLHAGHAAVYQRHVISGMRGPMNPGHHAILKFPDSPGSGLLATSPFVWGQVSPTPLENPAQRGYSCLQPGTVFQSLEKVRTRDGGWTDLSAYPARRGFEDIAMVVGDARQPFAWTAVSFPVEGYVWFALKDPRVLRQTIFWLSNGGRHYAPWNGRHVNVMGLEEVTSYFHYGLAESAKKNPLTAKGHVTCHRLDPKKPLVVNYIMAVAPIPKGFDHVAAIVPGAGRQSVRLTSRSGRTVVAPLDLDFIGRED